MKNYFKGQALPDREFEGLAAFPAPDHPDFTGVKVDEAMGDMVDRIVDPSLSKEKAIEMSQQMTQLSISMITEGMKESGMSFESVGLELKEVMVPGSKHETDAPDVKMYVTAPKERPAEPLPLLYSIHGGGLVMGSAMMEIPLLLGYAAQGMQCVIVQPEYRLAPEHLYPAAIEDCYAGLVWAVENAEELGIDPDRVVILGGSTGGTLTASLAHLARDRGGPAISAQVMLFPILEDRPMSKSYKFTSLDNWKPGTSRLSWQAYLGDLFGRTDLPPYAVPGRAIEFEDLPPAIIHVAELDHDRDDVLDYAQNLLDAGVYTELHLWGGTCHGFIFLLQGQDISNRGHFEILTGLNSALSGNLPCRK